MITTNNIPYVAVEINEIFKVLPPSLLEKIPSNVRNFFLEVASKDYIFYYDTTKDLNSQSLRNDTKEMLAIIYRDYICDEIEREEFIKLRRKIDFQKDEEKRKKYDIDNIFSKKMENSNLITFNKNQNILNKFISAIKKIFRKNKKD